jgi:TonB family protein
MARLPIVAVLLVAFAACTPRGAPVTPGADRAFFEEGDEGLVMPALVEEVHPEYTSEAKAARIAGSVMLRAVVDQAGKVASVEVAESLDNELGLDNEAVVALRQWRFSPGTRYGEPVPVRVDVEMRFSLR